MTTAAPVLYRVPDAVRVLRLSRTVVYDLIRVGRLRTVKEGRARLIPASAIAEYVALLESEAKGAMTKRRSRGDGGLHWDEKRQRWIATASLGYDPSGKRVIKRGSGRTKTEAKAKLKEVLRDYEDGLAIAPTGYTVANAVNDWLLYGLAGRDKGTLDTSTVSAVPM